MQRQFRHTYIVRYDECDSYGFLTPAAALRYSQDIAGLDAEDLALEGEHLWVVKRSLISFLAPIPLHTRLEITTQALGFTRITALRGYVAHDAANPQGEPLLTARTMWVYVDRNGRPKRMPEGIAAYWLPDGPLASTAEEPYQALPEREPAISKAVVRYSDLDYMQHLNNAAAVELLDNAAWEAYASAGMTPASMKIRPLSYDIEYSASTLFGEEVEIRSWFDPFPMAGQPFTRIQQLTRGGRVLVRADSRWSCEAKSVSENASDGASIRRESAFLG